GESRRATQLGDRLCELGVFALPIIFPMVAKDRARIRTIMNAAMTDEDVGFAIDAFTKAGRELKIL
ncbi:MAG: 8-amino-7-oxononanoate synthase, partial [Candidatus Thermoplasmatota archaeon]|nr:8-amino-7-oxononanoate synthase [Candidatus Thermoplasmatota archaeon]